MEQLALNTWKDSVLNLLNVFFRKLSWPRILTMSKPHLERRIYQGILTPPKKLRKCEAIPRQNQEITILHLRFSNAKLDPVSNEYHCISAWEMKKKKQTRSIAQILWKKNVSRRFKHCHTYHTHISWFVKTSAGIKRFRSSKNIIWKFLATLSTTICDLASKCFLQENRWFIWTSSKSPATYFGHYIYRVQWNPAFWFFPTGRNPT